MTTKAIVTKDSIQGMVNHSNPNYVMTVVGRALVAIYNRQTESEKAINTTTTTANNIGFTGCDAKSGSLIAKYYIKHNRLEKWMINKWLQVSNITGYSRICKYHRQLNDIAQTKFVRTID